MGKYLVTMGDFLKNAGIVGLNYMLDMSDAESGKDYGIKMQNRPVDGLELYEQGLWLDEDFVQQCDWTGMYFDACVNYYGDFTVYKGIIDRINKIICKIDNDQWKPDKLVKEDKEDIKFINDKLLSNSYKAGFENIRNEVDGSEIYVNLQQNKLNAKSTSQELKQRLEGIKNFIMQPKCKETFVMKSVIYNYINRFWDGKCFLLRANAKKDMRILFEQDFTKPFKEYIRTNHDKDKDMCIDCGRPMGNKERVSIAFMKDMADDLARKKSAFWNCKVDAFLCPACAFVYAASPLGFTLLGHRFAFMNTNSSINQLLASNSRSGKIVTEAEKKEAERYTQWFARMLKQLMDCKVEQLNNIQVILKGTDEKDKYIFSVISNEALQTFNDEKVRKALEYLGKYPYTRIGVDYLNIYENVVMNILKHRSQELLLKKVLKNNLDSDNAGQIVTAYWIYVVMLYSALVKKDKDLHGNGGKVIEMGSITVMDSGFALRTAILSSKGAKDDECIKGTIYQLLNALSTRNTGKFLYIVMRLYCTCKVPAEVGQVDKLVIPREFVYIQKNQELFEEYGYAFVLGLKGCRQNKKNEEVI